MAAGPPLNTKVPPLARGGGRLQFLFPYRLNPNQRNAVQAIGSAAVEPAAPLHCLHNGWLDQRTAASERWPEFLPEAVAVMPVAAALGCCLRPLPVPQSELLRFLARVRSDGALQQQLLDALSADEVSRLAQQLGYRVSGSDILRFHGQSASGIRITRIDHPGEYPGRYS